MIGYYAHHAGRGHLSQAMSICAHIHEPVTILSSLPRPASWSGLWVQLPRDDSTSRPVDPTASGHLHWVPVGDRGLQDRMARIAGWIARERPAAMMVDVSVEVCALTRLMGVPVVSMALPGIRNDPAHRLGYTLSDAIVAPWFASFSALCPQLTSYRDKVHYVGAFSRFDGRRRPTRGSDRRRRVLVLQGTGGIGAQVDLAAAAAATESWTWSRLGPGRWQADPWEEICRADVVITHAGLGAVGEVAAARKPAIVIPEARPHEEQSTTAEILAAARLAIVVRSVPPATDWPGLLQSALELGGDQWPVWSSGTGAQAAAEVLTSTARRRSVER